MRTNTLTIFTPEGIDFSLDLAGPVTRMLACAIDLACIMAVFLLLQGLFKVLGVFSYDFAAALSVLAYFFVSIGYRIFLEWFWNGQTIGKWLLQLTVMDVQGLNLQFSQVVIRNLFRFLDSLPGMYLIGGSASLLTAKAQRTGDLAANTIVVRNSPIPVPDLDSALSDKYNSFRDYPHLIARLRQRISPDEAGIAFQAIMRRNELTPGDRIALFREISSHFSSIVEFPREVTAGLSDEQYIRNVVDVLYRR